MTDTEDSFQKMFSFITDNKEDLNQLIEDTHTHKSINMELFEQVVTIETMR